MKEDIIIKLTERMDNIEKDLHIVKTIMKIVKNANITCKKCMYAWNTKTKMRTVSCPSCGTKNEVKQ